MRTAQHLTRLRTGDRGRSVWCKSGDWSRTHLRRRGEPSFTTEASGGGSLPGSAELRWSFPDTAPAHKPRAHHSYLGCVLGGPIIIVFATGSQSAPAPPPAKTLFCDHASFVQPDCTIELLPIP